MFPFLILIVLAPGASPEPPPAPDAAHQRSLARVEEAIRAKPDDPRLQLVLGNFQERAGRLQDALAAFEKARAMQPEIPEAVLRCGQLRARLNDAAGAISLFQAVIARGERPLRIAARAGLSDVFYQTNRFAEAAAVMKESLADGDRSAEAHFLLGKALDRQSAGLPEGEADQRKALEEEAAAALREAVRLEPTHPAAHYVLGMLLRKQGRTAEARTELEAFRAAKAAQTAATVERQRRAGDLIELRALLDLARAHLESASSGEALKAVGEALRLAPADLEARLLLGQIHLRSGRVEEAPQVYEGILRDHPRHPEALIALSGLRLRAGRKDEAAALALRAAESRRFLPEAYELLASLAMENGIFRERAEEFARKALEQRPSPPNYVRLAAVLHESGRVEECRKVVREGLARYPGNPELVGGMRFLSEGGR